MKLEKVIWDRTHNRFLDPNMINGIAFDNGNVHYISTNEKPKLLHNDLFAEEVEFFSYVGIDDIDSKKIYADSSIIEMYRGLDSFIGYYTYNKNKVHYEFIIIDGCDNDSFGNIIGSSLKIIDTIQENKLGLVK